MLFWFRTNLTRNKIVSDRNRDAQDLPKKHLFLPSGNFIWEIKSKKDNYTYFVDSNTEYCTCKGYYYNYNEKNGCYHLGKIDECIPKLKYKIFLYHDNYSREFLKRIALSTIYRP